MKAADEACRKLQSFRTPQTTGEKKTSVYTVDLQNKIPEVSGGAPGRAAHGLRNCNSVDYSSPTPTLHAC